MFFPRLKGAENELKPNSVISKKIHTAVEMCICICLHCVFLAAVDFKMGVDS